MSSISTSQMVQKGRVHVRPATNLPAGGALSARHSGFVWGYLLLALVFLSVTVLVSLAR